MKIQLTETVSRVVEKEIPIPTYRKNHNDVVRIESDNAFTRIWVGMDFNYTIQRFNKISIDEFFKDTWSPATEEDFNIAMSAVVSRMADVDSSQERSEAA